MNTDRTKTREIKDKTERLSRELKYSYKNLLQEYYRKITDMLWSVIYEIRHVGIRKNGYNYDYATKKAGAYYSRMEKCSRKRSDAWEKLTHTLSDKYYYRIGSQEIIFFLVCVEQDLKPDFLKVKEINLPRREPYVTKPSEEEVAAEKNYAMKLAYEDLLKWIDARLGRKFRIDQ
jgi:hypothetical protein